MEELGFDVFSLEILFLFLCSCFMWIILHVFLKRSERGDDVEATFEKTPDFIPVALALFCAVSDLSFK